MVGSLQLSFCSLILELVNFLLNAALQLSQDELLIVVVLLAQPGRAVLVAPLVLVLYHQPVLEVRDLCQSNLQLRLATPSMLIEYLQDKMIST